MSTLEGTLILNRSVMSEVVEDPNTTPRIVVSGTAGSMQAGSGAASQPKVQETSIEGEFRNYGNGFTRLILGSTTTKTETVALIALTPDQVQIVRDLLGHTVCFRDNYGRKFFGAYTDMQESAIPFSGTVQDGTLLTNIGIVLQNVTHDEAV